MTAGWWLFRRELLRFVRQPSRIVAAVGTAGIFWLLLASGLASFNVPVQAAGETAAVTSSTSTVGYSAFVLPGVASMVVLFSSIFAAISLIDDRQNGFLRAVLISPAGARSAVVGKLAACSILALAQALVVVAAAPMVGLHIGLGNILLASAALACIAVGVGGVCLAFAWFIDSGQGFHGVMNIVLMPMWLLSGSILPIDTSSPWLAWIMRCNPLTWPSTALRDSLMYEDALSAAQVGPWVGAVAFAVGGVFFSGLAMRMGSFESR